MPPDWAAFFFFLSWGPMAHGARHRRVQGFGPCPNPWRRRNSLPPSKSNPAGFPKGPALWGEKEVRPESRPPRSPVLQALSFSVAFQKCRPAGRHFSSFSPGAPSRMGRARWRVQGGGVPLGAGGIHFRRAGPIPTGVPKGPALWGEKGVRPEGCTSRSPVLQALSFIAAFQKCRPTGRHFLFSSRGPLPAGAKGDILIPYHTKEGK